MDDEGRSLSEVLTGRAQRPGLGPLERALQRNPRLMQLLDPVSAGDVAGWQAAQARGPYRPGNWLEQLQEEVRNLIPSVDKTTEQNLYAMNNIGAVGSARGVGAVPTPGVAGMNVFHGSPHKFEKFEMGKVGTGEGAQAYGHGLYFAENPKVAQEYANALTNTSVGGTRAPSLNKIAEGPEEAAAFYVRKAKGDGAFSPADQAAGWDSAIRNAKEWSRDPEVIKVLEKWKAEGAPITQHSNLYRVDLPDEQVAKMLDWDKPLSQQPESVKAAIAKLTSNNSPLTGEYRKHIGYWMGNDRTFNSVNNIRGEDLVQLLGGDKVGAGILKDMGIPGIKYLDQGSRAGGKGTSNFVVFDETIPKIIGRE